jgi:hypothetical protein
VRINITIFLGLTKSITVYYIVPRALFCHSPGTSFSGLLRSKFHGFNRFSNMASLIQADSNMYIHNIFGVVGILYGIIKILSYISFFN